MGSQPLCSPPPHRVPGLRRRMHFSCFPVRMVSSPRNPNVIARKPIATCIGTSRRGFRIPGVSRRPQEGHGGHRRDKEATGETRRSQEGQGGNRTAEQAQNCNFKIIEQPRRNRGAAPERTLPAGQVLLGRLGIVNGRLQTQGNVSYVLNKCALARLPTPL